MTGKDILFQTVGIQYYSSDRSSCYYQFWTIYDDYLLVLVITPLTKTTLLSILHLVATKRVLPFIISSVSSGDIASRPLPLGEADQTYTF